MTRIPSPDFTDTVDQEFFIEPQGGPKNPKSYLNNFPESIYTHDLNSNLVTFLYTLLGPAGVGAVRKDYLLARLQVEAANLSAVDLDNLYANPFGFARLIEETYDYIPTGLLTSEQWIKIQKSDASYRNRAIDFLKAVRAGGTLTGITLAAKSGLNRPVEVIENYKALYDNFSDDTLGLTRYGATSSTEEVIILPRQEVPTSAVQILNFVPRPTAGEYVIQIPIGSEANSTTSQGTVKSPIKPLEEKFKFDSDFSILQGQLEKLPVIGKNNVRVVGGPAQSAPFEIYFTGELADREMPPLIVLPFGLEDVGTAEPSLHEVEVVQAGVEADGEQSVIAARDWYYANLALEQIKPMTTVPTPGKAPGLVKRQVASISKADSEFTEVVKYVTGQIAIKWPETANHWIRRGVEIEAPVPQFAEHEHYINFHNIKEVSAYTEEALLDPEYQGPKWAERYPLYDSIQRGEFSKFERALYPFLESIIESDFVFEPKYAIADPPEPLTVTAVTTKGENVNLINGVYPVDYQSLPGIAPIPAMKAFWSSLERSEGSEFLEIDLGSVQAVNYLSLLGSNKPFDISISYDVLDQAPERRFVPVTLNASNISITNRSLGHHIFTSNPWRTQEVFFTNSLNNPVFTRFLRIEFKRRPGPPFLGANNTAIPYSIQVKSLRVGRNLSNV